MKNRYLWRAIIIFAMLGSFGLCSQGAADDLNLERSRQITLKALRPTDQWALPPRGPAALPGKKIVYIAEDLRNAGILGVAQGIREATRVIDWTPVFLDIGSADDKREAVFREAVALKPAGVILGGLDAAKNNHFLARFKTANIPVVGWHVAPFPGPVDGTPILTNITTDALEVARVAAHYAITDSAGKAQVVIFTDSRFDIAQKKMEIMTEILRDCDECAVLAVKDIPLDRVSKEMPKLIQDLLDQYGAQWTYSIATNDLYFDHSIATLIMNGLSPSQAPVNISAGEGSPSAFMRIQNNSYQKATVPEPLLAQGWQLIDELNRIMSGQKPSGYTYAPHIVTPGNIWEKTDMLNLFELKNDYMTFYIQTWIDKRDP